MLLASNSGGSADKLYSDDVFSTWLYTGNGSTQTINNGIDLAGKGGLVWIKDRNLGTKGHHLVDTTRGATKDLQSQSTNAQVTTNTVTAFNSNGFAIQTNDVNDATGTFVSWTFRKAPKFFDVVTYTGDGVAGRQIPLNFEGTLGQIIIKRITSASLWAVWHRGAPTSMLVLNESGPASGNDAYKAQYFGDNSTFIAPTSATLTVGSNTGVNNNGDTYVAYLFAHDTSVDGIIQCGSFTTDGSGNATVNLGWEPQFVLRKRTDSTGNWFLEDVMRGSSQTGVKHLFANASDAETDGGGWLKPTSNGFQAYSLGSGIPFIYLAIRRPNKPPTSGAQVYNAIARTGNNSTATVTGVGFTPDVLIGSRRTTSVSLVVKDRLRGVLPNIFTNEATAEANSAANVDLLSFNMDGVSLGPPSSTSLNSAESIISYFFRRAPGVFDVVCYTGTGAARTVAHNLGVVPELMIVKGRSGSGYWATYHAATGNNAYSVINATNALLTPEPTAWNSTSPTTTQFTVGTYSSVNTNAVTYVAYLFATKAGISKVGSYTGNGSSQTINCGFSTGARFVLIKRTDSTGDWYVWNTARGIVSANDPHLSLNTTAVEVTTDDSVDPDTSGFIVNQVAATNINVNAASYIFLAIA